MGSATADMVRFPEKASLFSDEKRTPLLPAMQGSVAIPRSFPHTNIGFTRCWQLNVRKSAKAGLRWESSSLKRHPRPWTPAYAGVSGKFGQAAHIRSFPRKRESSSFIVPLHPTDRANSDLSSQSLQASKPCSIFSFGVHA